MAEILVIRLSSLGDVVLTAPVFRALRLAYPDAKIVALVKEEFSAALKANPDVQDVMTLRKGESLWSLAQRVRARHFDTVIDLHANLRSRVVSFCSGARQRVRYQKAALARRLYVGWRLPNRELARHTLDRYMDALRRLNPNQPLFRAADFSEVSAPKILVIQTAFLGDAVLTTPLVTALHERYPKSSLSLLCTPEVAEVFNGHPGISELIVFDKRGAHHSFRSKWVIAQDLRKRAFDLAVIPHRSLTSALLAALAGIPRRIGFSSSQGRWLLTERVPFQWGVHDVDRNLSLLKPLGGAVSSPGLWLRPEVAAVDAIQKRLEQVGVSEGTLVLGINAGSVWATKRWLPERFAAVADRAIRELGAKVIFVGGPKDVPVVERVVNAMKEKPVNWAGATSLSELIAVIFRCSLFLTNDSGPLHIAVAAKVPTVALFGPTTRELGFFPYGPGHVVIERPLECRPCGLHGADKCPLGHFRCMTEISSDEVFGALLRLNSASADRPIGEAR